MEPIRVEQIQEQALIVFSLTTERLDKQDMEEVEDNLAKIISTFGNVLICSVQQKVEGPLAVVTVQVTLKQKLGWKKLQRQVVELLIDTFEVYDD